MPNIFPFACVHSPSPGSFGHPLPSGGERDRRARWKIFCAIGITAGHKKVLNPENSIQPGSAAGDVFATTRWTVVLAARIARRAAGGSVALEELCRTYWYPLYALRSSAMGIRGKGVNAEDLTQAFFVRLLDKNFLEGISSEKGKFRAFLLVAVKRFLANEWDRANRQKRGGGEKPLSLDWQDADTRYQINPADNLSPDRLFDRAWAVTTLERVITRLRDEYCAEGKAAFFEQLKPFLMLGKKATPAMRRPPPRWN